MPQHSHLHFPLIKIDSLNISKQNVSAPAKGSASDTIAELICSQNGRAFQQDNLSELSLAKDNLINLGVNDYDQPSGHCQVKYSDVH